MCKKHGLESSDRWYEHTPADVMENDEVELYWDLTIQTDMTVAHNRPHIILVEKAIRKWKIVETAILPVVTGALGTVPKRLIRSIELLGIGDIIASTQMTALLETAGILCRAMNL